MAKTTDPKTGKPAIEPVKLDTRVEAAFLGRPPHERFLATAMYAIIKNIDPSGGLLESVLGTSQSGEVDWTEQIDGRPLIHYNGKSAQKLREEGHPPQTIKLVKQALGRRGIKMDEGQPSVPEPVAGEPIHPASFSEQQRIREDQLTAEAHARARAQGGGQMAPAPGTNGAPGGSAGRSPDVATGPEPGSQTGEGTTAPAPNAQRPATNGPEPTFAGHPLSDFEGMSRDQILEVDGINPTQADRIIQLQGNTGT